MLTERPPIHATSTDQAIRRWKRLVCHLVCESAGYFTLEGAANALLLFKRGEENWCEWFLHMAGLGRRPIREVAADTIRRAIRDRRYHTGYMGSYPLARTQLARYEQTGESPLFMSW